jgi:hypothetical protein
MKKALMLLFLSACANAEYRTIDEICTIMVPGPDPNYMVPREVPCPLPEPERNRPTPDIDVPVKPEPPKPPEPPRPEPPHHHHPDCVPGRGRLL